jgi:hypothetical protein
MSTYVALYFSTPGILQDFHWRAAMSHARIYQHGVKAFIEAKPLSGNPYDSAVNSEAHEAWEDGWLDANHSRWRSHAFEMTMRAYAKSSRPTFVGSL